jgi:hypothetical protein
VGKSGEKMGRVAPGYLADSLLVDGNPLLDPSLLQDRNALLAIMKDGQLHKPFQGGVAPGRCWRRSEVPLDPSPRPPPTRRGGSRGPLPLPLREGLGEESTQTLRNLSRPTGLR